jgi:hypothetical protein
MQTFSRTGRPFLARVNTVGEKEGRSPRATATLPSFKQVSVVATSPAAPGATTAEGINLERQKLQERCGHLTKSINNLQEHIDKRQSQIGDPSWGLVLYGARDMAKACDRVGVVLAGLGACHVMSTFVFEGMQMNPWLAAVAFAPLVTGLIKVLGPNRVIEQVRELKEALELQKIQQQRRSLLEAELRKSDRPK